ncbi:hypothetical protein CR513_05319, partial [Mucuna pruriens]
MANIPIKIFSLILFFVLFSQGHSQCSLSDLSVSQVRSGTIVEENVEWIVTITNRFTAIINTTHATPNYASMHQDQA